MRGAGSLAAGIARVMLLLALVALPGIAITIWLIPNATGPFVFGALPSLTALVHAGPRLAAKLAVATAGLGFLAVLLGGLPWAAALLVGASAWFAGRFAGRGLQSPLLMVPVVAAYLVTEPIKFEVGHTLAANSWQLAATTAAVLLGGGLWATVLGMVVMRSVSRPEPKELPASIAHPYAWAVGVAAGLATYAAATWAQNTSAAWIVLTVILVIQPDGHQMRSKTRDRVLGTFAGGGIVGILVLLVDALNMPNQVLVVMGMLLLSASLALASKVAYWRYVMLITPGV
ncbi:MAG: hypothetical protein RJB01_944, partial [Actinomycetota bacterium]